MPSIDTGILFRLPRASEVHLASEIHTVNSERIRWPRRVSAVNAANQNQPQRHGTQRAAKSLAFRLAEQDSQDFLFVTDLVKGPCLRSFC